MQADLAGDVTAPTMKAAWIVGDWNFLVEGDTTFQADAGADGAE